MSKYLLYANFTEKGARGLLKEGGTRRRAMVEQSVKKLGGSLEAFYFSFGDDDVYSIVDLPDKESVAALSLTIGAAGAADCKTAVLVTPEEMDEVSQKSVDYRAPGA